MTSVQFDVFAVTAKMTIGGGPDDVQCTMHWRQETPGALTDAQVLADLSIVLDALWTGINAHIVDIQDYIDISIKNVTQNLLLGSVAWPTLVSGGSTADPVSFQTVALLLMKTAAPRVVGRLNLGVFRDNGLVGSNWISTVITDVLILGGFLLLPFVQINATWRYVVFNREFATLTIPNSTGITVAARTQRRRSRGIGT